MCIRWNDRLWVRQQGWGSSSTKEKKRRNKTGDQNQNKNYGHIHSFIHSFIAQNFLCFTKLAFLFFSFFFLPIFFHSFFYGQKLKPNHVFEAWKYITTLYKNRTFLVDFENERKFNNDWMTVSFIFFVVVVCVSLWLSLYKLHTKLKSFELLTRLYR